MMLSLKNQMVINQEEIQIKEVIINHRIIRQIWLIQDKTYNDDDDDNGFLQDSKTTNNDDDFGKFLELYKKY